MARAYSWSLSDQVSLSAFHFLLSLTLIRAWEPGDYGTFVFWQGVTAFCMGIQNAMVIAPLAVFAPAAESSLARERIESVIASANVILVVGFFVLGLIAMLLIPFGESISTALRWVIPAFVASMLIRGYARAVGFASQRIAMVIWADGIYLVIAVGILLTYWVAPLRINLLLVFGFLAAGSTLGGLTSILIHGEGSKAFSIRNFSFRAYKPIWDQSRWSTLGAVTTQLQNRGHVFIVTALAGTWAVGFLAAGEILFRPLALATTAWQQIARPHLARLAAEKNSGEFVRNLLIAAIGFAGCMLVLFAALYLLWAPLRTFIYGEKYAGIGWIVVGWGAVAAITNFRAIMGTALQSTKRFRPLAFATLYGCVISLTSVAAIIVLANFKLSMIGIALGGLFALIYVFRHFSAGLRNWKD